MNNDGVKFAEEFRNLCAKYVKNTSILTVTFNDGTTVGMKTLWEIGLGVKQIEECLEKQL